MRKRLSIKIRITLWYALLLLVICLASLWLLMSAARLSVDRYCEDTLKNASIIIQDELEIEHGYLEIDDDIDDVPNVYAALFHEDGSLLYGRSWMEAPFVENEVRSVSTHSNSWYVYDVRISVPGWENTWLRLIMSANELSGMRQAVWHYGLLLLPLLAVLALLGGYWLTVRAFRPVQRISDVTNSIVSAQDLSARVASDPHMDGDELHHLGHTINRMLSRLENAFQREQQFTSDAAHELRTPLNAIITQGEYALSRTDTEEKDEAVEQMLNTANEMNAMVRQLLMLSRLESGQMEKSDVCDLAQLLSSAAEDMEPLASERGMRITSCLVPCTLSINRSMLMRAVINLLDNAIRYGNEDSEIILSMERKETELHISVANDGPGLTEAEMEKVFTRFWRADASRAASGSGVGLSLVQSIAKAHGGSVQVSSAPGENVCFTMVLPIS